MAKAAATMTTARATTENLETQASWISVTLTTKDRHASNFRSFLVEHSEVSRTLVNSGTNTKRVSNNAKTMCSSMTTKKSSR